MCGGDGQALEHITPPKVPIQRSSAHGLKRWEVGGGQRPLGSEEGRRVAWPGGVRTLSMASSERGLSSSVFVQAIH